MRPLFRKLILDPASSNSLLDSLSWAGIYSVRKMNSAYTGNAIRVRRSSDSTFLAIGFTNTGDLDTASLLTFVGSGSGFIQTWYDQSGNARDAIVNTAASQPRIVNAGVLDVVNNKPAIYFNGSAYQIGLNNSLGITANVSAFSILGVAAPVTSTSGTGLIYFSTNSNAGLGRISVTKSTANALVTGGRRLDADSGQTITSSVALTGAAVSYSALYNFNNTTLQEYMNGGLVASSSAYQTSGTTTNANSAAAGIGSINGASFYNGYHSEIMLGQTILGDSARQAIEASQKAYFGL